MLIKCKTSINEEYVKYKSVPVSYNCFFAIKPKR